MSLGLTDLVAGIFKPAAQLIDDLHTSKEEKLQQKAKLLEIQAMTLDKGLQYELETLRARAGIVQAEAESEHWVTATWRPITMLVMVGLAVGDALGWWRAASRGPDLAWVEALRGRLPDRGLSNSKGHEGNALREANRG